MSTVNFIVVPETIPEYFIVMELPPISRTTSNDTLSPSTLPFVISTDPPRPPSTLPVRVEPLVLNVNVWGPPLPIASLVHLPSTLAAKATKLVSANSVQNKTKRFFMNKPSLIAIWVTT